MSRVGKLPVKIPDGVSVTLDPKLISISGAKGSLEQATLPEVNIKQTDNEVILSRSNEGRRARANHGLMRALVNNMVTGVSQGFSKKLEISGVGYRVNLAGQNLKLSLGYSHEINYQIPEGITVQVEQNTITVSGISKQKVGQTAAEIRALKKPEPYKGKGISYQGEKIIRKSGKSGKE